MNKTERIIFRITPDQKKELAIYSKGSKQSISNIIRLGINKIIHDERK